MTRTSAGLLMYRWHEGAVQVFLVHMGGPYWAQKDEGAWTIPKGEFSTAEKPLDAARREFQEETGYACEGEFIELSPITQPAGKVVYAWAFEGDCDPSTLRSNTFKVEWPPKSGQWQSYPEADRGDWFDLPQARQKILRGQVPLLDELERRLISHGE